MKKVLLLLVAVSFSFVSCDKNDDNQVVAETSPIHGKWEVKSFNAEATVNGTPIPDEDLDFNHVVGTVFEFKAGNTIAITTFDDFEEKWTTDTGTYVYYPSQNKVDCTMTDVEDGSKYTQTMNIKLLNATNYNFNVTEEEKDGGDVYKLSMDINCEKVK